MRRRARLICALGLGLILAVASIWAFAPQLPLLAREGFPAPIWPASGQFAQVAGGNETALGPALAPGPATRRFMAAEGRALVIAHGTQAPMSVFAKDIGPQTQLNSYSLVKSLVGVLVLKAVADGKLASLDIGLRDVLGAAAPAISLREIIDMTAGLALGSEPPKTDHDKALDDADFSPFGPVARLHAFGIETLMPRLRIDAGRRGAFHYQSANTALLGLVLEQAYGQPLPEILSDQIWIPSGAGTASWRRNPTSGRVSAYCCLYATALDWAKVAQFLMRNGTAEDPFLPNHLWRNWILPTLPPGQRQTSVYQGHMRHDILDRAGATVSGPFAYMMGHDGQVVYMLPKQDTVVVRFGEKPQLLHSTLYELFP